MESHFTTDENLYQYKKVKFNEMGEVEYKMPSNNTTINSQDEIHSIESSSSGIQYSPLEAYTDNFIEEEDKLHAI